MKLMILDDKDIVLFFIKYPSNALKKITCKNTNVVIGIPSVVMSG